MLRPCWSGSELSEEEQREMSDAKVEMNDKGGLRSSSGTKKAHQKHDMSKMERYRKARNSRGVVLYDIKSDVRSESTNTRKMPSLILALASLANFNSRQFSASSQLLSENGLRLPSIRRAWVEDDDSSF